MFNSTSAKIALGIILITSIILISINIFTIDIAKREFRITAQNIFNTAQQRTNINNNGVNQLPADVRRLQRDFEDKITNAVWISGAIGVVLAILAAYFYSGLITRPLKHLLTGINELKVNNKFKLAQSGEKEFDQVINEFNVLVSELAKQEELRRDLISDVGHELKTPLTALIVQIEAIHDKVLTMDEERYSLIQHQLKRINSLIDTLKEYTTIRSGLQHLKLKRTAFKPVIDHIVATFRPLLAKQNIRLKLDFADDLSLNFNPESMERVLNNLIDNTLKYAHAKNIRIAADSTQIVYQDDGKGIPESHQAKIFERFYRVESSRNRSNGGLGLGLALVKEIVEAHGWSISVTSGQKTKGTKFTIKTS